MWGFIFVVKLAHQPLPPRWCLSQPVQAKTGQRDPEGRKYLPPWGSSEEPSSSLSAPQALFQSIGWGEGMDGLAQTCAKSTQRLSHRPNTSHPLLPTHCCSLPGGHRLPSPLPLHCSQQGILHKAHLIRDAAYSLEEMQPFCCLTDL